ncbi:SDR family NAD(P)-dependent oxidoreductase [Sphingomonas cavernae]|uniref:SDR family oxidoreductase n=1 Tax=Sphingomonas cavernae TaxID=2320861 RepID=A0A418WK82_9SPHN|nr:SDR family oxidoreductase [Sphingomonas cavernae]RJF90420.1 SDR family oxidoreductase [Sphingomonas cavernae]
MTHPVHILVTGSSRGIGAAIAERLTGESTRVIGHSSRTASDRLIACDLAVPDTAPSLWQAALDRLDGRIDVLINNAGIFEAAPIEDAHDDWVSAWDRTMQVNLTAAAELSRLAVLHFREIGGGRIINIASRAAYRGDSPAHWHYAASKAGMIGMTKSIARGYAAEGIYAFAICPGFTMTGMAEAHLDCDGGAALLAEIPLGRVAEPAEIAEAARFLALDAPPSMTGAVLDINGASYVR